MNSVKIHPSCCLGRGYPIEAGSGLSEDRENWRRGGVHVEEEAPCRPPYDGTRPADWCPAPPRDPTTRLELASR